MSRIRGRAKRALEDVRESIRSAEVELMTIQARLEAYRDMYLKLEKSFAPKLRQSTVKPVSKKRSSKQSSITPMLIQPVGPDAICGKPECGAYYDDKVHHQTVTDGYHAFRMKPPAGTAGKSVVKTRKKRAVIAATTPDTDPNAHCQKTFPGGFVCDEPADANVHHLRGATGYHEFEAGEIVTPLLEMRSKS